MKNFYLFVEIILLFVIAGCQKNVKFPWAYNEKKCISNYNWAENKILNVEPDSIPLQIGIKQKPTSKSTLQHCFYNKHYQLIKVFHSYNDSPKTFFSTDYVGLFLENDTTHFIIQNTSDIIYPDSIKAFIQFVKMNNIKEELPVLLHKFYFDNPFSKMNCLISGKDIPEIGFKNIQTHNSPKGNKKYTLMLYPLSIDKYFPYSKSLPITNIDKIPSDKEIEEKDTNSYFLVLVYFNKDLTENDAIAIPFESDYESFEAFKQQLAINYECNDLYKH